MPKTDFSHEDVTQILRLVDALPDGEVRIELDHIKLHVRKGEVGAAVLDGTGSSLARAQPAGAVQLAPPLSEGSAPSGARADGERGGNAEAGLVAVRAPMLGRFYRASTPGDPPFVEVGSKVAESDPVCLIEVMKLFTTINAGVAGTVVEVKAANNDLVEFDQVVFTIRPE